MKSQHVQAGALAKEEWDFSRVPDSEIRDCCLYEYAREAEPALWKITRRQQAQRLRRKPRACDPDKPEKAAFPIFQHLAIPSKPMVTLRPCYIPPPWQLLTKQAKDSIKPVLETEVAGRTPVPVPLISVSRGELQEMIARNPNPDVIPHLGMQWGRGVCFALKVFLDDFPDAKIEEAFQQWLTEARAAHKAPGPGKAGAKTSAWQANLDNLGIMRLRHFHTIAEIEALLTKHPLKFWNESEGDGTQQVREKADQRRERVLKFFREHFPDLGPDAKPEHWETSAALGRL